MLFAQPGIGTAYPPRCGGRADRGHQRRRDGGRGLSGAARSRHHGRGQSDRPGGEHDRDGERPRAGEFHPRRPRRRAHARRPDGEHRRGGHREEVFLATGTRVFNGAEIVTERSAHQRRPCTPHRAPAGNRRADLLGGRGGPPVDPSARSSRRDLGGAEGARLPRVRLRSGTARRRISWCSSPSATAQPLPATERTAESTDARGVAATPSA